MLHPFFFTKQMIRGYAYGITEGPGESDFPLTEIVKDRNLARVAGGLMIWSSGFPESQPNYATDEVLGKILGYFNAKGAPILRKESWDWPIPGTEA